MKQYQKYENLQLYETGFLSNSSKFKKSHTIVKGIPQVVKGNFLFRFYSRVEVTHELVLGSKTWPKTVFKSIRDSVLLILKKLSSYNIKKLVLLSNLRTQLELTIFIVLKLL